MVTIVTERTEPEKDKRLVVPKGEAARRLSMSLRKLHDLIKDGEIKIVRSGRSVYVAVEELERFVESHTVSAKS